MKADHPRTIDRYIDFFGDGPGMGRAAAVTQMPGDQESESGVAVADRPVHRERRRAIANAEARRVHATERDGHGPSVTRPPRGE